MLVRLVFTLVVVGITIWLLATGYPLGGLLIFPLLAVWVRHAVERARPRRSRRLLSLRGTAPAMSQENVEVRASW